MSEAKPIKTSHRENKVIYIYHQPESSEHKGWLKIGDQTGYNSGRVKDQNMAANIRAETLYMDKAIDIKNRPFRDYEVHAIIDATGKFEREPKKNTHSKRFSEWYKMTKNEAIEAIEARKNLKGYDPKILQKQQKNITPRQEQQDAINETYEYWKNKHYNSRDFLWNAKPRFGKTLTSYWFAEKIEAKKILIATNRPAISDSWYTDYHRFIQPKGYYKFGATTNNKNITSEGNMKGRALNASESRKAINNGENLIFFISLQDIKGKDKKNAKEFKQKNQWLFNEKWDLFVIDESHEATETPKAQGLFKNLNTNFTLHLSGTPFKALANKKFRSDQIYNWTYEDEQIAKDNWDPIDGENPYYELPRMNMYAYKLSSALETTVTEDGYAFDLNELFKTAKGVFMYESAVLKFLDNLFGINSKNDQSVRPFPFADSKIRDELRHTFWLLPSVASVKTLKKLMQYEAANNPSRKIFGEYEIIDAAAKGDKEHEGKTALEKVKRTIGEDGRALKSKTITLSCGQLTTGVTVKPWTAVLMLYGAEGGKTSATKYLQAAFRGQNPWKYTDEDGNDIIKDNCYVFDFAPDRLLLIFQDYARSVVSGGESTAQKIKKVLNVMFVVAEDDYGEMKELNANDVVTMPLKLMTQEIVNGKFITSNKLFNIGNIFHLPEGAREILNEMGTVKKRKVEHDKTKNQIPESEVKYDDEGNVIINESALVNKKYSELKDEIEDYTEDGIVTTADLPPSEMKDALIDEAEKEQKKQEEAYRDHLRYFARAIPIMLMAYGKKDTALDNFEKYIDSSTFSELVGITKQQFQDLRDKYKLFNEEVFNSSIIEFLDRKAQLAEYYKKDSELDIFDYIPPQQTNQIFTPKPVVKLMVDKIEEHNPGIFKSKNNTFLDPYMKSGLFITEIVKRLYVNLEKQIPDSKKRLEHILTKQVYGLAPTKILHLITNETIFGFMRNNPEYKKIRYKVENNFILLENIEQKIKKDVTIISDKIREQWNIDMHFTAILGNPPYHYEIGRRKIPIYNDFIMKLTSPNMTSIACFITPDGFIKGGQHLEPLRQYLIKSSNLKYIEFHKEPLFDNVAVDAAITLFDNSTVYNSTLKKIYTKDGLVEEGKLDWQYRDVVIDKDKYAVLKIFEKIIHKEKNNMSNIIPGWAPFGINTKAYKMNKFLFFKKPNAKSKVKILVGEDGVDFFYINGDDNFSYKGSEGRIDKVTLVNSNKWKVTFPKAGHVKRKPLKTRILEPGTIFTDKFLCVFTNSKEEAINAEKYFNSTFYRAGLDSKATSWNLYRNWHSNIPIQDFTNNSDIDWSRPLPSIDIQLFNKYGLKKEQIDLIKNYISN